MRVIANGFNRIEVIDPRGDVAFFDLKPDVGVTTIGSDEKSDIMLHSPGLDPVHAVLFYDARSCQMLLYSDKTPTYRDDATGDPLPAGQKHLLKDGDTLRVNGHVLVYLSNTPADASVAYTSNGNGKANGNDIAVVSRNGHASVPASQMTVDGQVRALRTRPTPPLPAFSHSDKAHMNVTQTEFVAQVGHSVRVQVRVHHDERRTTLSGVAFEVWAAAAKPAQGYGRRLGIPAPVLLRDVRAGGSAITDIELKASMAGSYEVVIYAQSAELGLRLESKPITLWVYAGDVASATRPANLVLEMPERQATADTGQPALYQFTVTNDGNTEANILITIEPFFPKVPGRSEGHWNEDWVVRKPTSVYLHNGTSATLEFSVDITGVSNTQASLYPIQITASTSSYPQSRCSAVALLRVDAREGFEVTGLAPTVLTHWAWFGLHSERKTRFVVENHSNCAAPFVLEALDRAGECDFRFAISDPQSGRSGNESLQPSPARIDIGAGDIREVTVFIRPRPRTHKAVSFVPQVLDYTVTTTMQSDPPQTPRQVMGQVRSLPWLHPLTALAALFVLFAGAVLMFWPRATVLAANGNPQTFGENLQGGSPIRLNWQTWSASNVLIGPSLGSVETTGQRSYVPALNETSLTLSATNILNTEWFGPDKPFGRLLFQPLTHWLSISDVYTITGSVSSVTPTITSFQVENMLSVTKAKGEVALVNWTGVDKAITLTLSRSDKGPVPLIPNSDYAQGQARLEGFNISGPVVITLTASNPFASSSASMSVTVSVIPRIIQFNIDPRSVIGNGMVRVQIKTDAAKAILTRTVGSGPDEIPPLYDQNLAPNEKAALSAPQTITYVLIAKDGDVESAPQAIPVEWHPDPQSLANQGICADFKFIPGSEVQLGTPNASNLWLQYKVKRDAIYSTTIQITGLNMDYYTRSVTLSETIVDSRSVTLNDNVGTFDYTLRVTREGLADKPEVCSKVLKVTAAKLPPPQILTVNLFDAASNVLIPTSSNTWSVQAGQKYTLKWSASANTKEVVVGHSDINLPSGSTDSYPFVARTDPAKSKITLKPVRSDGEVGDLFTVYLNVVGIPEPNQVQDFTGKVVTDGTKLSWSYGDVRGEGFEIRRQDKKTGVIDGTFSIKKGDIEYKDMEFTCDKTYNIFVKYLDEDGKSPIPSQSSGTRPFSSPDCVPPTVEPPPDLAIQTGGVAQSAPPTPTAIP